jgi:hypothetical protein
MIMQILSQKQQVYLKMVYAFLAVRHEGLHEAVLTSSGGVKRVHGFDTYHGKGIAKIPSRSFCRSALFPLSLSINNILP